MTAPGIILDDIYSDYPDQDEMIWSFVGRMDFNSQPFQTISIDPVEWFEHKNSNGESIKDMFAHAEGWQKKLVKSYRGEIRRGEDIGHIVVHSGSHQIVDGFHRLVALAQEGVRVYDKVVDLSSPEE
jgi:hypothetical protein